MEGEHGARRDAPLGCRAPGRTDAVYETEAAIADNDAVSSRRRSIAKHPLDDEGSAPRSIFPTYDPAVPLRQQHYAPTQLSPAHLPREVISRQSVYEAGRAVVSSPPSATWPPRARGRPLQVPTPCGTADLKDLWRVANGWKASPSEGRVFCLRLTQHADAPVYALSSAAAQPLWELRLDPTSASAYAKLTRRDPSKPHKPPPEGGCPDDDGDDDGRRSTRPSGARHWHEVLMTTLEEESRRHAPRDGLVAELMPSAAARMVVGRTDDAACVAAAENERARLVWDDDTAAHYLAHNALQSPFCVVVDRNAAYSTVEYTLEHHQSPGHIARLTRDGTGAGWIELDTAVASQIASCYILDVAVASLLLVLADDDRKSPAPRATFAPPPSPPPARRRNGSFLSGRLAWLTGRSRDDGDARGGRTTRKMDEFGIDIESQSGSLHKQKRGGETSPEEELPFLARVVAKLARGLFALVLWTLSILFKCLGGLWKLLRKCLGSKY